MRILSSLVLAAGLGLAGTGLTVVSATPAQAEKAGVAVGLATPVYYYRGRGPGYYYRPAPPRYYAPPPRVYYRPPLRPYYAPRYYAPRPSIGFSFRF
jgi:hypothetical protein